MTVTLTTPRTSLSHLVTVLGRLTHRVDYRAELIAELQTAPLVPAVLLPGIEHQDAGEIVRTGLQSVIHSGAPSIVTSTSTCSSTSPPEPACG
ncbi:hypothetical protein SAMN05421837_11864 [Amycolatopsis pretoriensis]|uniref:Uncharacterized protein n=1 Tax=Amycolatopsis pretoriensis TaxID=218821 RepID=A0A1H5RIC0_9PSEU|nr:hypothetical protein [Amycolatopsis pretoriensis]SEF38113.1 hypothetical protein SAMN05421837_11864 [Amycolatopsis pretoriensis]